MELHKVTSRSKETAGNTTLPMRCQVTYLYDQKIGKRVTRQCSGTMHLHFDVHEQVYRGLTRLGVITEDHMFKIGEVFKTRL